MAAPLAATGVSVALMLLVAVVVGCVESLTARLPLHWVPRYTLLAAVAALLCMALVGMGSNSV
jgi:formate hydrogenlyase subunit 4